MKQYAVAALVKNHQVLMGKRMKNRLLYPDCWSFFGGHCEPMESYDDCIKRELREELGIEVQSFEALKFYDQSPQLQFQVYVVNDWLGEVSNQAPEEHSEICWFPLEEALKLRTAAPTYQEIFELLIQRSNFLSGEKTES
jgi:mutator protein MutT